MIYRFGDHVLDEELFQLRRGADAIPLEPKVFDVLRYLLQHREQVVSKQELLDRLWPGEAVSDSVLPRCIAVARRALGDDRTRQAVIATIHGRGYRFVAEVEPQPTSGEPRSAASAQPNAAASPTGPHDPFVGRQKALERLDAALADAAAGRGRVCLLCGDPGIGKTRTKQELAARALAADALWLEGACYEGEGAPAYWPFAQVLRELVPRMNDTAREDLRADAGELAAWVPALDASNALPAIEGEGPQGRFRLFDAVTRALHRTAGERPIAIAIDDLHWADHDSVLLFDFLARELGGARVLLIGTYREIELRRSHPLANVLSGLAREPRCETLRLRGLDEGQVANLGAAIAGHPLAPEVARSLAELTDGNPFFVREIVRLLEEEGRLAQPQRGETRLAISLPQSVRDAVGRRLDALSPECNRLLRIASAMGRSFETSVLEAVCEHRGEELLEVLAEPLAAGIVREEHEGPGRYRFDHALTRQILYDELSLPERVRLHRAAASALEALPARAPDERLAEIAYHAFEAIPGGDVERAIEWCERAARHAHRLCAYEESARHYERALEALQYAERVDEVRRCELTLHIGSELRIGGQREAGRQRHAQAAEIARSLKRPDLFARAAIGFRGFGEMGMPPDDQTLAMLEQARDTLGDGFPSIRAELAAQLVGLPPYSNSMSVREGLSREALAAAEQAGEPGALASALMARYWATLGPDRLDERLETADQARRLAVQMGEPRIAMLAHEIELGAHLVRGDRAGAQRALDAYCEGAETLRMPVFRYLARMIRGSLACNEGRFSEAETLIEEALAIGERTVPYAAPAVAGFRFWLANVRGEALPDLAEALDDIRNHMGGLHFLIRVAGAGTRLETGRPAEARSLWGGLVEQVRDVERDEHWLMTMNLMSKLASDLRDRQAGALLHELLAPYRELMIAHDLLRGVTSSVSSVLGELEHLAGDLDAAIASFEIGIERERAFGAAPARLGNAARLGFALAERGRGQDGARAASLAAEAADGARELGLRLPPAPGSTPRAT